MTHRHLQQRLTKLETQTRRGHCRCDGTALFAPPHGRPNRNCERCGRPPLVITITDLPAIATIAIPEELLPALRRASDMRGGVDLTVLSAGELDQLGQALTSLT